MIEIARPLMVLTDADGNDLGLPKSTSEVEAMEKASKLPDGEYLLVRPTARITVSRGVAVEPDPERKFVAGARFALRVEVDWSKEPDGDVALFINNDLVFTYEGANLFSDAGADGARLAWGIRAEDLTADSRYLYVDYPNDIDGQCRDATKTTFSQDGVTDENGKHKFFVSRQNIPISEYICSNAHAHGTSSAHERIFTLPDDWVSADDPTTILFYQGWPGAGYPGHNIQIDLQGEQLIITVRNSLETVEQKFSGFLDNGD